MFMTSFGIPQCNPINSGVENNVYILERKKDNLNGGYIKGYRTKYISLKFFSIHDFEKKGEINVQQICSANNLADLFTKLLPTSTFEKLVSKIGMRRLQDTK